MSTRLNKVDRERIIKLASEHACKPCEEALKQLEENFKKDIEKALKEKLKPLLPAIKKLPEGTFYESSEVKIYFQNCGKRYTISIGELIPILPKFHAAYQFLDSSKRTHYHFFEYPKVEDDSTPIDEIHKIALDYHLQERDLLKEKNDVYWKIKNTVDSYTSVKRLLQDHPNIQKFTALAKKVPVKDSEKSLNELLAV